MSSAIRELCEVPILNVTAMGEISSANRAACTAFGYEASELVGQPVTLVLAEEAVGEAMQMGAAFTSSLSDRPENLRCGDDSRRCNAKRRASEICC